MAMRPSTVRGRFFDAWSRVYDAPAVQAAIYRPVHEVVLDELRILEPASIVDIGCGTGLLTDRLRSLPSVRSVVGCDLSAGMLREASARTRRVSWTQADAVHLPLADGCADAVTSTESFHWIPDQPAALRGFHRVLRPGGAVLIGMVLARTRLFTAFAETAAEGIGQQAHWPTQGELESMLRDAGFREVRVRRVVRAGALLVPTAVVSARR